MGFHSNSPVTKLKRWLGLFLLSWLHGLEFFLDTLLKIIVLRYSMLPLVIFRSHVKLMGSAALTLYFNYYSGTWGIIWDHLSSTALISRSWLLEWLGRTCLCCVSFSCSAFYCIENNYVLSLVFIHQFDNNGIQVC